jgi:hypothetical protein
MAKKKRKSVPRAAALTQSRAAGLAAATRGRARTFDDKRTEIPSAKEQIDQELKDLGEQ